MFSPSHQILNDFLDALLGGLHTFLCSLQSDPLTVDACTRETDSDAAVLLRQLPQHLTSPAHKVPMMADVDLHAVLHHIILEQERISLRDSLYKENERKHCVQNYQVFDQVFQLLLGLTNCFLFANYGDHLLLAVVWRWENDARACLVPHTANVGSTTANQEFMILRFGLQLSSEVVDLLKTNEVRRDSNSALLGF